MWLLDAKNLFWNGYLKKLFFSLFIVARKVINLHCFLRKMRLSGCFCQRLYLYGSINVSFWQTKNVILISMSLYSAVYQAEAISKQAHFLDGIEFIDSRFRRKWNGNAKKKSRKKLIGVFRKSDIPVLMRSICKVSNERGELWKYDEYKLPF